jgi:CRISPR system Cascade subunit CasE
VGYSDDDNPKRLFYARYEGRLQVTNIELLLDAVMSGIGPAKGFGFGLLSLAPVKDQL